MSSVIIEQPQKLHFWVSVPWYSRGAAQDGHLKLWGILLKLQMFALQVLRFHYNFLGGFYVTPACKPDARECVPRSTLPGF
jgi:hypothetical protein